MSSVISLPVTVTKSVEADIPALAEINTHSYLPEAIMPFFFSSWPNPAPFVSYFKDCRWAIEWNSGVHLHGHLGWKSSSCQFIQSWRGFWCACRYEHGVWDGYRLSWSPASRLLKYIQLLQPAGIADPMFLGGICTLLRILVHSSVADVTEAVLKMLISSVRLSADCRPHFQQCYFLSFVE